MPQNELSSKNFHQVTKHSYLSVQLDPNYIDSTTQPSACKRYPKFYRRLQLNLNHPIHSFIYLTSAITLEKTYKDVAYKLRVNPTAGGLYPTEIYVQIRGIPEIVDGIYHLEVENNCLTLIYELIDDGLESYIIPTKCIRGIIFLISCVYYRSSWKYKNRSLRFDFDKLALNSDLGFENKEFVTACVLCGDVEEKNVRRLRLKVPFVCGTDYFEANQFIEDSYEVTALQKSSQQQLEHPKFKFDKDKFYQTVWHRRSSRRFRKQLISQEDYFRILLQLKQPIPTESCEAIKVYSVVHRVEGISPGLYQDNQLIKSGDFSEHTGYLCINQAIARDCAVTLFFVSDYTNYQTAMQLAGFLGHRVYLSSNYLGIQCSAIGAFYDDETQSFLETTKDILYAIAIGN
jgi:hypothetical protein